MVEILPDVPVARRVPLVQMTANSLTAGGPDIAVEPLTEADAPAMLALAILTRPGPFRSATRGWDRSSGSSGRAGWSPWRGGGCGSTASPS